MTPSEFYTLVRETLNRGGTLDGVLPQFIQMAVRDVERTHDFSWLDYWADVNIGPDDQVINLPVQVQRFKFVRFNTANDGETPKWEYAKKVRQAERTINRVGLPERYWLSRRDCLVFDAIPDKVYPAQMSFKQYTSFPAEDSGDPHWILADGTATTALHSRVMMLMANFIREDDPTIRRDWARFYQEAMRSLIIEESSFDTGDEDAQMEFWPDHIPYDRAFRDQG